MDVTLLSPRDLRPCLWPSVDGMTLTIRATQVGVARNGRITSKTTTIESF